MTDKTAGAGTAASAKPAPTAPTILLFGDSHTHAVQRAIELRSGRGEASPLTAFRLAKMKNGKRLGDISLEQFIQRASSLSDNDVVLSMIGGNQHAVFSMIQHPQAYDFYSPDGSDPAPGTEIIPYHALEDVFRRGLGGGDTRSLIALRKGTKARVVHIIPPPPKKDNAFILQNHETNFAAENLAAKGVSSPELRLKYWKMQTRILSDICQELGIEVMMPPAAAVDPDGFLLPDFYAQDATHGNHRYGERVLREVEARFLRRRGKAKRAAS